MTVLIQLGSCGASWPQNTTPIQRLKAISPLFDRIVLADTSPAASSQLQFDRYVQLERFTPRAVLRLLRQYRGQSVVVWIGPSARLAMIVLLLRFVARFRFVVDLYDHERLSSGVARARGAWLKSLQYRLFEGFTDVAARRADLLVSAIAEERYAGAANRVKAVNGLASVPLRHIIDSPRDANNNCGNRLTIGYVGVVNGERADLLRDLAAAVYGSKIELLLIGENDPAFVDELRQIASRQGEVSISALGFLPWDEAMRRVADCDYCLYPFPTRPELDCVYPIKMGEYMALAKPVIATDSTAIREVFANCPGVIRCDFNRPGDWVSAVRELAANPSRRRTLGDDNRSFALDRLDWATTQKDLLERLRKLLATMPERPHR